LKRPHPRRAPRQPTLLRTRPSMPKQQATFMVAFNGFDDICCVAVAGAGSQANWSASGPIHLVAVDRSGHVGKEYISNASAEKQIESPDDAIWLEKR
jgi:hypothetical protein